VSEIVIERARLSDVEAMKKILDDYAASGDLLARSRLALYECVRDFFVARRGDELVGLGALHVCWADLGEVRSLAVRRDLQGSGVGRALVDRCLADALGLGLRQVFTLTYRPGFFQKLGFEEVDKSRLPHKVWQDCVNCSKFPDCDEVAMLHELGLPSAVARVAA